MLAYSPTPSFMVWSGFIGFLRHQIYAVMKKAILILFTCLSTASFLFGQGKPKYDPEMIPSPVFDDEPGYVELYWKAWEQAYDHVKYQQGLVQPLYMDEGLWDDTIWIWDSEFMVMFCKYAPELFPGIQTLDNFYYTMLESSSSSLRIQHPDNPAFFPWVEAEYYKFTGDKGHLRDLIHEKKFLQRYYDEYGKLSPEVKLQFEHAPISLQFKEIGYLWSGVSSGMDNTPRTRPGEILWVDAIAQRALSALYISRLAKEVGDKALYREFRAHYLSLKKLINRYYWDRKDHCYYDVMASQDHSLTKILTPASFWPVLAEIPAKSQVRKMAAFALHPDRLGGSVPWVTVSRSDEDFDIRDGHYWKGAMWLPTAYMAIKSLEKYGLFEEAGKTAESVLQHVFKTYRDYDPHTIWECYSPVAALPSTNFGERVRPDFCGWSALGPISLFIENVLGFYDVDAASGTVRWNLHQTCRHGIERLSFGDVKADIVYDNGVVHVRTNKDFILVINGKKYSVPASGRKIVL